MNIVGRGVLLLSFGVWPWITSTPGATTVAATDASRSSVSAAPAARGPQVQSQSSPSVKREAPGRYDGNAPAIAEGAKLFVAYNCADCHGPDGTGLMASSLQDHRWRYGGSNAEVFASIVDGRPEGMPRWGALIPRDHVWKLVAYIRTLGAGKDVSTMNFTGKGIERAGH
ncbi:MAG: c-type cytochrome [Gemmatimonadaceae bacterium]